MIFAIGFMAAAFCFALWMDYRRSRAERESWERLMEDLHDRLAARSEAEYQLTKGRVRPLTLQHRLPEDEAKIEAKRKGKAPPGR